ncbi:hypothetical protein ACFL0Y_00030 [Patescibacteria group bacterium]
MEKIVDINHRPTLRVRESQILTQNRLLNAAKEPDEWSGPLGSAAEIALSLDDTLMLLKVGYRNDILSHRDQIRRGFTPDQTEEEIRKEWFGC